MGKASGARCIAGQLISRWQRAMAILLDVAVIALAVAIVGVGTMFLPTVDAEGVSDGLLAEAVTCLRGIDPDALTYQEKVEKSAEIDRAWQTLMNAGTRGRDALVSELEMVLRSGEPDTFFKLSATALLWRMTGADDADLIARTWRTASFEMQYRYVFSTAYEAALTRDERVLPMLVAFLSDKSGSTFIPMHSLDIQWPLGVEFVWGAYGPAGFTVLAEIIEESSDPVTVESALTALTYSGYLQALPAARRLAVSGETAGIRQAAVRLLGWHGHPQDWEVSLRGLMSEDAGDVGASLWALYEFDDERGDQYAIEFLDHPDDAVRSAAAAALLHLSTADGLEALLSAEGGMRIVREIAEERLSLIGLAREEFLSMAPSAKKAAARELKTAVRGIGPRVPRLDRKTALAVVSRWLAEGCVSADGEAERPYALAQALLPEDLIFLQQVRAKMYARVSDEALYDVHDINLIIQQLIRRTSVVVPCPP